MFYSKEMHDAQIKDNHGTLSFLKIPETVHKSTLTRFFFYPSLAQKHIDVRPKKKAHW
ncbi:uncharacterized protein J3R85_002442 [Psidium guajava]|nr:uncharacterized protein J3R85_002442 [Psidium guajava]